MNAQIQARPLPPWHDCYRAAILESDNNQLPGKISVAVDTLMYYLKGAPIDAERRERDRILHALRMLELLRKVSSD
jgi:hypothetical protein